MKKLAIMFVMLLGSVATMQAQSNATFNFSCASEVELEAIFSSSQIESLMGFGLTEGFDQIAGMATPDHYAINIQLTPNGPPPNNHPGQSGSVRIHVSVVDNALEYAVSTVNPNNVFAVTPHFGDALNNVELGIQRVDRPVFTTVEVEMLETATFALNVDPDWTNNIEVYNFSYTITEGVFEDDYLLSIAPTRTGYVLTDSNFDGEAAKTYFDTLAEALAAAQVIIDANS